jgi:hypothetical protein
MAGVLKADAVITGVFIAVILVAVVFIKGPFALVF